MKRKALAAKAEAFLERESLGFEIGDGEEVIDFLARLEMHVIEQLLASALAADELELLMNWIEERKGELPDRELPAAEVELRARNHERLKSVRGRRK